MNLNIFIPFVVFALIISTLGLAINEEEISVLTYVDEIELFKKLFNNFNEIKNSIDLCNSRYEEYRDIKEIIKTDSAIFDIRFDDVPLKCKTDVLPRNCAEATACIHRSGIYKIQVGNYSNEPFLVECDVKTEGGDWLLIQRRQDGSVYFNRNWAEYQKGFGKIDGEFFIGLDKLHALTNYNGPQELLIVLEDKNETRRAKYGHFVVGNEIELYALQHLGVYSGDAGNALAYHLGCNFTTKDQDHDNSEFQNCAQLYSGGWWYNKCHLSNLNGKYGDKTNGKGVNWETFRVANVSVEHVKMMIRRRTF